MADVTMSAADALKYSFDTGDRGPFEALFAPGCVNIYVYINRRFANLCHSSPGILLIIGFFPCTTSSWLNGSIKFSP